MMATGGKEKIQLPPFTWDRDPHPEAFAFLEISYFSYNSHKF